jgi:hypothetical protein
MEREVRDKVLWVCKSITKKSAIRDRCTFLIEVMISVGTRV